MKNKEIILAIKKQIQEAYAIDTLESRLNASILKGFVEYMELGFKFTDAGIFKYCGFYTGKEQRAVDLKEKLEEYNNEL